MSSLISMISFMGTKSPTNPLTRGFAPGPHWVLRPQTHTIATVKQCYVCILMKMHKNCCHQSCSSWLRYARCTKSFVGWCFAPDPTGGAYSAPPDPIAGLGVGPPGRDQGGRGSEKEKEEGERGEGRGGKGVPERPNPESRAISPATQSSSVRIFVRHTLVLSRN